MSVCFDDGHLVAVNRELKEGLARKRDKAEAISLPFLDVDYSQVSLAPSRSPAFTVD
jgi:hypothetical protein